MTSSTRGSSSGDRTSSLFNKFGQPSDTLMRCVMFPILETFFDFFVCHLKDFLEFSFLPFCWSRTGNKIHIIQEERNVSLNTWTYNLVSSENMETELLMMIGCLSNCIEQENCKQKHQTKLWSAGAPCVAFVDSGRTLVRREKQETMVKRFVKEVCLGGN